MLFSKTIIQVGILLVYIGAGFILAKTKIIKREASKVLAALLTYFIHPIYTANKLATSVSIEKLTTYGNLLLYGTLMTIVLIAVAFPLGKVFAKNKTERGLYRYLFAFSNYGYFGCPLVDAVFGSEVLANFMIFTLPVSIAIHSYGYYILTRDAMSQKGEEENLDKKARVKLMAKRVLTALYTPPMIGTYLGLTLAFIPVEIPKLFFDFLAPAVNCYNAIPMMIAGIVLAGCPFKKLFTSFKAYIVGIVRLVIMPLVFGGITYLLYAYAGLPKAVAVAIIVLASLPCGMNVVVYPETVGLDSTEGARACFLSYLMGIITIPLVFTVMQALIV